MTTAQIPKSVADRITATAMAEHREWQLAERQAALAELAKIEAEWEAAKAPLDDAITEAMIEVDLAKHALERAERELAEADAARRREWGAYSQQERTIRCRLEDGDLLDDRINDALNRLEDLSQQTHETKLPELKDNGPFPAQDNRELVLKINARLEGISQAREAILALRYSTEGDLTEEVDKVFAGIPAL